MATNKEKEAARRNIGKARQAHSARAHGSLLGGASGNGALRGQVTFGEPG